MKHPKSKLGFLLAAIVALTLPLGAQTLTTGEITGTVKDPTGAMLPGATVQLKSVDTGATQSGTTNSSGQYQFTLLKPGHYTVTGTQAGFQTTQTPVEVAVGQVANVDVTLPIQRSTTTVEVTSGVAAVNTEPSEITSFNQSEMQLLPTAGGDITNIAFTAPGVVVNSMEVYGNFSVNGLPGTSNLFTINGENDMDPYFNINNSGATNLTIGQNEIQEASVITNPYSGQ